jgi:hypothetical protein
MLREVAGPLEASAWDDLARAGLTRMNGPRTLQTYPIRNSAKALAFPLN